MQPMVAGGRFVPQSGLDADPALLNALTRLDAAATPAVCRLPQVPALSSIKLVRWLWRAWTDRAGWQPLVHLRWPAGDGPLPNGALADAAFLAEGGWLFLDAPHAAALPDDTACTVIAPTGPEIAISDGLRARIERLDTYHVIASDPALARVRKRLWAHCTPGAAVHLRGPAGSGKESLARWAHARSEHPQPLAATRRARTGEWRASQWLLISEPSELNGDVGRAIVERVDAASYSTPNPTSPSTPRPKVPAFEGIVGESRALVEVLERAARYAPTPLSVLVLGEAGTGKEGLARAIHVASGRRGEYVALDLSTLSESMLEAALFGHVRGAFSGAVADRAGAVRTAHGGTLFLDEIGNLSLSAQTRLLRLLETREVQPIGSDRSIAVDVRIIAATNADLADMVRRGTMREDLFQRFNPAATLRLPPLRERPDDITALAHHFAASMAPTASPVFSERALQTLAALPWPGNVRELRNVVQAAIVEASGGTVTTEVLTAMGIVPAGAPILVTSNDAPENALARWPFPASVTRRLTAVTVDVPGSAAMDSRSIRNAIFAELDGRPLSPQVVRTLEQRKWRGGWSELRQTVAAIVARSGPTITIGAVDSLLPAEDTASTLRVVIAPAMDSAGRMLGVGQDIPGGVAVVGRAGSLADLATPPNEAPARRRSLDARRGRVLNLAAGRVVRFLRVEGMDALARAHVLLATEGQDLTVARLPGAALTVRVRWLSGDVDELDGEQTCRGTDGALVEVAAETPAPLRILASIGVLPASRLRALLPEAAGMAGTLPERQGIDVRTAADARQGMRVRALTAAECAALVETIARWLATDEPFAATLRAAAREYAAAPETAWLAGYLESTHPTQSCVRLFQFDANAPLRAALRAALAPGPNDAVAAERLPQGIREALDRHE